MCRPARTDEIGHAVAALDLGCRWRFGVFDDRQPGAHGALDVVFARFLSAERGQHAVAGVLQHAAVVRLHDRREALERSIHHGVDLLGLEVLAHGRRAHHVDEQHGHLLELLAHGRPRASCSASSRRSGASAISTTVSPSAPAALRAQQWPLRVAASRSFIASWPTKEGTRKGPGRQQKLATATVAAQQTHRWSLRPAGCRTGCATESNCNSARSVDPHHSISAQDDLRQNGHSSSGRTDQLARWASDGSTGAWRRIRVTDDTGRRCTAPDLDGMGAAVTSLI